MKKDYNPLGDPLPERSNRKTTYALLALGFAVGIGYYMFANNDTQVQPKIDQKPTPKPNPQDKDPVPKPENPKPPVEVPNTKSISEFEIVRTYKRTGEDYYTDKGTLLESAGLYDISEIHYVNVDDMKVVSSTRNDARDFAEGADFFNDGKEIIQLTWRERNMHIYDAQTLQKKKTVPMPDAIKEGWGIARRDIFKDGIKVEEKLYVTDGSDSIHIMDPKILKVTKTIRAFSRGDESPWNLNELEFVEGKLWANIYLKPDIAIIDPDTGFVEAYFRPKDILNLARREGGAKVYGDCLNGIAYHPETKQLLLTGKRWPVMWQIRVKDYAPGL